VNDIVAAAQQSVAAVLDANQARAITDRIKTGLDVLGELVRQAFTQGAWHVLGYLSWDEYVRRELGTSYLRVPSEERAEILPSLKEAGMSNRQIASALGIGEKTVRRELTANSQNNAANAAVSCEEPEMPIFDVDAAAEELIEAHAIIDSDGEPYHPPAPKPEPWTDEEKKLREQLETGETVVVSLRGQHARLISWAESRDLYVRVDRRTDWGNPFEMPADGDRDTVIANYRDHYLPHKPSLSDRLDDLRGKALGCWCAPEPCHADVLKELSK
jgi:hypothetical protein